MECAAAVKLGVNKYLPCCNAIPVQVYGSFAVAFRRLKIATKLYAIFALLATVTLAIAVVAVLNARRHAVLTDEFRATYDGARQLERINSLIYAVVMESRGLV